MQKKKKLLPWDLPLRVHRSLVSASYTVYNCRGDNRSACFHWLPIGSLVALVPILRCRYTCAGGAFCQCIVCGSFADKTAREKVLYSHKIQRTNIDRIIGEGDSHGGDRQSSRHRRRKSRRKIVECSFRRRKHYTGGKRRRGAKNRRC